MDAYLLDVRPSTLCTNGYYGFEPPRVKNHSCVAPRTLRKRSYPDSHPEQTTNGFAETGSTENGTWALSGVVLEAEKAKRLCPEHYHSKLQGVQVTTCRIAVSPEGVHNGEILRQEECHGGGVRTPSATSGGHQMCPIDKPLSGCSHDAKGSLPGWECPKCLAGDPGHLTHIIDCQQNSHMPMQMD